ncbi:Isocitrate/Isopropylmalate dehydrogenase-like protein, partial [Colletotrichum eremochloae]
QNSRFYSSERVAKFHGVKDSNGNYLVSLIKGDRIGPEISQAVKDIFTVAKAPITWEPVDVTPILKDGKTAIPDAAIESIQRNKIALKGLLATPIGKGYVSLNLTLCRTFNLFANLRPCRSVTDYKTLYDNINTVLICENTEDKYLGIKYVIVTRMPNCPRFTYKDAHALVSQYGKTVMGPGYTLQTL